MNPNKKLTYKEELLLILNMQNEEYKSRIESAEDDILHYKEFIIDNNRKIKGLENEHD